MAQQVADHQKGWKWYAEEPKRLCQLITPQEPTIKKLSTKVSTGGWSGEIIQEMCRWTAKNIQYDAKWEGKALPPQKTLSLRSGVCLEYANLAVTMAIAGETDHASHVDVMVVYGRTKEKVKGKFLYHAWAGTKGRVWTSNGDVVEWRYDEPQTGLWINDLKKECVPIWAYNQKGIEFFASQNEIKLASMALCQPALWVSNN